jgi:hypothetical protein
MSATIVLIDAMSVEMIGAWNNGLMSVGNTIVGRKKNPGTTTGMKNGGATVGGMSVCTMSAI